MKLVLWSCLVLVYVCSSSYAAPSFQFGGSGNINNMSNGAVGMRTNFLGQLRGNVNQFFDRIKNRLMRLAPAAPNRSAPSRSASSPAGGGLNLRNIFELVKFYNNISGNNRRGPGLNLQFGLTTGDNTNPNMKSGAGGGLDIGKLLAGLNTGGGGASGSPGALNSGMSGGLDLNKIISGLMASGVDINEVISMFSGGSGAGGLDLNKIISGLMASGVDINQVISMFSGGNGASNTGSGNPELKNLVSTLNSGQGVDGEVFKSTLNTLASLNTMSRENDPNSAGLRSILSSAGSTDESSIAARQLPITLLKALSMSDLSKSKDGSVSHDPNAIIYSSNKQNTNSRSSPDTSEIVFGSRIDTL